MWSDSIRTVSGEGGAKIRYLKGIDAHVRLHNLVLKCLANSFAPMKLIVDLPCHGSGERVCKSQAWALRVFGIALPLKPVPWLG